MSKRLIIVSNRLPFHIRKRDGKLELQQSDGGLVSALKSYFENPSSTSTFSSVLWTGSAEFNENTWSRFNKKKLLSLKYEVNPVFIDKKVYDKFYNGFCNATLWPLFHYFPSLVEFNKETFKYYEEVNQKFADHLASIVTPDDIVWIHDYQLMLLPAMLRAIKPTLTIGFFLHIPFPSFEVFRLLHKTWKEKLTEGMLGADLIGFHTHEYVQHFLKTIRMIKGYDHQFRTIFLPNRTVKAEMFPLGIDFEKFNRSITSVEVVQKRDAIRKNFSDKRIIFSVDRLDYTKGITHRLLGFERFLDLHGEWIEKVVFIIVVVPSRQIVSKYNERKKLIEEEIGRINGKYSTLSWQPIIYRYNSLPFWELSAMYSVSDVALITPLRDGMNLVAKEYIASRENDGVLILSELAGAASELSEAILVNPTDQDDVADAINGALIMPHETQQKKIAMLQQRLRQYTVIDWMTDFLRQLGDVKKVQQSQSVNYMTKPTIDKMVSHFQSSSRRLFLLDYDGTLVPFSKHPSLAIPDLSLLALLDKLLATSNTDVVIISGRDGESLEKWFGHLPVSLVSEHGASIRWKSGEWQNYVDLEQDWKAVIKPLLDLFTQRSPGAFIEEKSHTLVWHYRNVDPELGFIRSRELLDNLYHIIRNSPLNILDGNKVIEVRVKGIDKGVVTRTVLDQTNYDFVMAIGDDKTDEDMFKIVGQAGYSIKIGLGNTSAKFQLNDQREVLRLLAQFVNTADAIVADRPI